MDHMHNKLAHPTPTEAEDILGVNCMVAYTTWHMHCLCRFGALVVHIIRNER